MSEVIDVEADNDDTFDEVVQDEYGFLYYSNHNTSGNTRLRNNCLL
jgi:hypothetical protein